jgi:Leucine-rich repeat (LRR) protein
VGWGEGSSRLPSPSLVNATDYLLLNMYKIIDQEDGTFCCDLRRSGLSADEIGKQLQHAASLPVVGSKIVALNLSGNNLIELPSVVCTAFPNLQNLSVENNKLQALPEQIGTLTQLEVLEASDNKLTRLPNSMKNLVKLEKFVFVRFLSLQRPASLVRLSSRYTSLFNSLSSH